jgi:hypothetical protein
LLQKEDGGERWERGILPHEKKGLAEHSYRVPRQAARMLPVKWARKK